MPSQINKSLEFKARNPQEEINFPNSLKRIPANSKEQSEIIIFSKLKAVLENKKNRC